MRQERSVLTLVCEMRYELTHCTKQKRDLMLAARSLDAGELGISQLIWEFAMFRRLLRETVEDIAVAKPSPCRLGFG